MTDYVLITPNGQLTEHEGYPAEAVGCHGYSGQTLHGTVHGTGRDYTALRAVGCDCAAIMPEQHQPNPTASAVLTALGFPLQAWGAFAIYRIDWQNEPLPLTDTDLTALRTLFHGRRA